MSAPIVSDERRVIPTSMIGSVPVIVFQNTATNFESCWVCDSLDTLERALTKLRSMPHIANIRAHHAAAMFDDSNGLKGF